MLKGDEFKKVPEELTKFEKGALDIIGALWTDSVLTHSVKSLLSGKEARQIVYGLNRSAFLNINDNTGGAYDHNPIKSA